MVVGFSGVLRVIVLMLCGVAGVQQAAMLDGLALDPLTVFDDGSSFAEVGVRGCCTIEALEIAPMVVVFDEGLDLAFEVTGQEVVLEPDAVLERLMPAFDLFLCLGGAPRNGSCHWPGCSWQDPGRCSWAHLSRYRFGGHEVRLVLLALRIPRS